MTGWGNTPPTTITGWVNPTPLQLAASDHLLCSGGYASCIHAGRISFNCWEYIFEQVKKDAKFQINIWCNCSELNKWESIEVGE